MSSTNNPETPLGLVGKIARLAGERGWDVAAFAQAASLHRATAQQILAGTARRLQDNTVKACADAFGVSPLELRVEPITTLIAKMREPIAASEEVEALRASFPVLTDDDVSEILAVQEERGPQSPFAMGEHARRLERRRRLANKVLIVAGTEYVDLLEQFVDLLYEKVQPYADRRASDGVNPSP
jgi:Helix-turn-helix